jgi:hypothetical protein
VQPKKKILALIFGLVLPYIALVLYFVLRNQGHPQEQLLPTWFPYFGMAYILGTILLVSAISRRIARSAQGKLTHTAAKPRPMVRMATRAWAGYLIVVWCGFFLYGAVETIKGKFEWQRALPAGAFLLIFIVLFSRWLYTDNKKTTISDSDKQGTSD